MIYRSVYRLGDKVCSALATLGVHLNTNTFVAHPGVVAVTHLLEMKQLVEHRAHFTQDSINAMYEFDSELAERAQVAFDHNLPISWYNLDYIDKENFLEDLIKEKKLNAEIAEEILNMPVGKYEMPKSFEQYKRPAPPVKWRTHELAITQHMVEAQPSILKDIHVQKEMSDFIENKYKDEEIAGRRTLPNSLDKKA